MELNKTLALALHRAMWTDMQTSLGDNPSAEERKNFKYEWIKTFFPDEHVANNCFLCEFACASYAGSQECQQCPISWPEKDCCHPGYSYTTAPISAILALPERGLRPTGLADIANDLYYKFRDEQLSKASGLPACSTIVDHVKAIEEKAVETFRKTTCIMLADEMNNYKNKLSEESGLGRDRPVDEHISAIKEKAVEEYFEKNPGAKLATMDVDQAFKQYADEQKAPIFHALAEASGLSADESVKAHIYEIKRLAKQNGRMERSTEIFDELSEASGLSKGKWCVSDHVKAIQERAKEQMEPYVKSSTLLVDTLNKYKDYLSDESGLDRNRPVGDHIHEIVKNSMEAGAAEERDRIQEKIYEVLLS